MTSNVFDVFTYIFENFKKDGGIQYTLDTTYTSLTYRGFKVIRLYSWKASVNAGIRVVYEVGSSSAEILLFETKFGFFGLENIIKFVFELQNG